MRINRLLVVGAALAGGYLLCRLCAEQGGQPQSNLQDLGTALSSREVRQGRLVRAKRRTIGERLALAESPQTAFEVLFKLSRDPSVEIRQAAWATLAQQRVAEEAF